MADDLIITIGAAATEYNAALDGITAKTEALNSNLQGMAVKSGLVFAGLTASIGLAVEAFSENEQAGIRTNAILQATGDISGVTAEQVKELGESLEGQTTYTRGAIEQGENLLLTFTNIGKDVFPAATQASLDLAARMGGDVSSAAQVLGRALQDPMVGMTMLRRAGIELTTTQKAQIETMQLSGNIAGAQKIILDTVTASVGGLSQATAGGTGVFRQLGNVLEELWAQIGEQLAPVVIDIAQHFKTFLQTISDNKDMVSLIAAGLVGLTAAVGSLFAVSALSAMFLAVTSALAAFGVATSAATLAVIGLAGATGIGLLAAASLYVYNNWNTVWPQVQAVFQAFVSTTMNLLKGIGTMLVGLATANLDDIKSGFNTLTQAVTTGFKTAYVDSLNQVAPQVKGVQAGLDAALVAQNFTRNQTLQKDQLAAGQATLAYQKANAQLQILEDQQASASLIAIKKQEVQILKELADAKFQGDKTALQAQLIELQNEYNVAYNTEIAQTSTLYKTLLKSSEAYQKMSTSEQKLYLATHQKQLTANIETELIAEQKVADQELKLQTDLHNQMLEKQVQFGSSYAQIWASTHSAVLQQSQTSFSELSNLTQSNNEELKAVGKAASIAQILMKTAQSAMNIFEGWSSIPYVGYALGIAGAAAAIAFGAEQVGTVLGLSQGGLVAGGTPGQDSVMAFLTPGELVAPAKNFNEVVNSVASSRSSGGNSGQSGVTVTIDLSRSASQFLTVKQNEDKALGISRARAAS